MPTAPIQPNKPKRDSTALAFLIAMGIALATTAGAALTAAGTGAFRGALGAVASEPANGADRSQQAADVARIEDRLEDLVGEIEILKSRPAGTSPDRSLEERLNRLDQDLTQVKADTNRLENSFETAAWNDEVASFRANFANTDIELGKLRASIDERDESRRHAIADLSRRLDRLERAVASSEETGSIAAAAPHHRGRPGRGGASGWSVQDARFDYAVISSQGMRFQVWPGTFVPGLGRVVSVRHNGSRWIVATDKGVISQRAPREPAGAEDRDASRSLFSAF